MVNEAVDDAGLRSWQRLGQVSSTDIFIITGTADTHPAARHRAKPDGKPRPTGSACRVVMALSLSSWNLTADRSPLTKPPRNTTESLLQSCWRMLQEAECSPQRLVAVTWAQRDAVLICLETKGDNSGVLRVPIMEI